MSNLDEIRKKLQAIENKSKNREEGERAESDVYNHWDLPDNSSSIVRFLPDGNPDNVFFWQERQMIKLPFPGVKGGDEHKLVEVTVPCADMWGKNLCPITREIGPWWDDASLKPLASKYWKKRSYLMHGFVIEDGTKAAVPSNVIKRFVMNTSIFKIIKATLLDPDMANSPVDFDLGTNFKINKTKNGTYADYTTSVWARRESALNDEQRKAILDNGLKNLADFLPKRPGDEELRAIFEMFEASVNGELYDPARWGQFYKPYGLSISKSESREEPQTSQAALPQNSAPAAAPKPAEPEVRASTTSSEPPFEVDAPNEKPAQSAADILAALRARKTG